MKRIVSEDYCKIMRKSPIYLSVASTLLTCLPGCTALTIVDTAASVTIGTAKIVGKAAKTTMTGARDVAEWALTDDKEKQENKEEHTHEEKDHITQQGRENNPL